MALVPVLLFGSGLLRLAERYVLKHPIKVRLRVPKKGICLLVAFVMLLGPESFHNLSQADVQYANLNTASWANGDTTITYTYDNNGSVETKTTVTSSVVKEVVTYHYNLAGRLVRVWTDTDSASSTNTVDVADYKYNDAGIRVEKYSFSVAQNYLDTIDEQTYATGQKTTTYLVDSQNHTGYAQVLEEWAEEGNTAVLTCYTLGDDVIAQTKSYWQFIASQWELQSTGNTQYLLYDGHGSTRQLVTGSVPNTTIVDDFSYDGYGVLLQNETVASTNPGKVAPQATSLLYAGEQFDTDAQHYYNRARWYDPLNGRFNRTDPFFGNLQDPQSLHKYLYCHANPVNVIDPTGLFFSNLVYGKRVHDEIGYKFQRSGLGRFYNKSIKTILNLPRGTSLWCYDRPDLVDAVAGEVYEIKPAGAYLIGAGQLWWYLCLLNVNDPLKRIWKPGVTYTPHSYINLGPLTFAVVSPPVAGIIIYEVVDLKPAIALLIAYETYAIMAEISARIQLKMAMPGLAWL